MDEKRILSNLLHRAEGGDVGAIYDAFAFARTVELIGSYEVKGKTFFEPENFDFAHESVRKLRLIVRNELASQGTSDLEELYKRCLLFDAPFDFDSAIRYAEFNREQSKQFYLPRRKQLLPVVNALQQLEDGKLDVLCISEPPGIGKSTLAIMYMVWTGLKNPDLTVLGGSHSNSFLRGVYDEILRMLDDEGEYLWCDIFPRVKIVNTNAKEMRIDLQSRKRFETYEFSSIGSGNAGKVRATNLLYCDDLVDGIETAMNKDRLDKLWQQYTVDYRQRKQGNMAKELHIATRWSIHDVIGRLESEFENDDRAKFIRFAALNENDESNFDYPYGVGFSTEFYHAQRNIMDDASWRALYMNEPIEREGQLYAPSELKRYFSLPSQEPDAIFAVCDTKEQGGDYCVMPICYKYGQEYYVDKFICDQGKVEVLKEKITNMLVSRKVQRARFESNRGGTIFAQDVQNMVKARGGKCQITTKWNQTNKETRIIVNSAWVKEHCVFKDESLYPSDKEYMTAMKLLCGYTMAGKNKHDDVPDAMSDVADFVDSFSASSVGVMSRSLLGL